MSATTRPWVLDPPEESHVTSDGYHVIHVGKDRISGFVPDDVAHLIAAAPALYDAAWRSVAQGHHDTCSYELLGDRYVCDCGHDALLAALSTARPAPTEDEK